MRDDQIELTKKPWPCVGAFLFPLHAGYPHHQRFARVTCGPFIEKLPAPMPASLLSGGWLRIGAPDLLDTTRPKPGVPYMKTTGINTMTEPMSSAVGGIALYKLGAFGGLAVLAAVVVMAMTLPKTAREFVVAMISTTVASLCGGAFVVRWLDIGHWAQDDAGVIAIGGIIFTCGLPAWVLVRAWFKWAEKRRDAVITDMLKELAEAKNQLGL